MGSVVIESLQSTITDGSGSSDYTENLDCKWIIDLSSHSNVKSITVVITSFDLEYRYDTLTIFDGNETSAAQLAQLSGLSEKILTYQTTGSALLTSRLEI